MIIYGDIKVFHSKVDENGIMTVRFDGPENCFSEIDVSIPTMCVKENVGFNEEQIEEFLAFCARNIHTMSIYSASAELSHESV
jgi:hypothetical protein